MYMYVYMLFWPHRRKRYENHVAEVEVCLLGSKSWWSQYSPFSPWSFLEFVQKMKSTILGPCGKKPYWDPARKCQAGPQGRAGPGPPIWSFLSFG